MDRIGRSQGKLPRVEPSRAFIRHRAKPGKKPGWGRSPVHGLRSHAHRYSYIYHVRRRKRGALAKQIEGRQPTAPKPSGSCRCVRQRTIGESNLSSQANSMPEVSFGTSDKPLGKASPGLETIFSEFASSGCKHAIGTIFKTGSRTACDPRGCFLLSTLRRMFRECNDSHTSQQKRQSIPSSLRVVGGVLS